MKGTFGKPYRWAAVCSVLLLGSFIYVLLDTFVLPKAITVVAETQVQAKDEQLSQSKAEITDSTYKDEKIKISIEKVSEYDSQLYVADIQLTDAAYLKTALAKNTYGRNIFEKTSEMAKNHQAIFAVNGDFYGFRDNGYVLRNGVAYRDVARESDNDESLAINSAGEFSIIRESMVSMDSLKDKKISQIFCFGPVLIQDKEIKVNSESEVRGSPFIGKNIKPEDGKPEDGKPEDGKPEDGRPVIQPGKFVPFKNNPRTAIGQISPLHYVVIVVDGRTKESKGLTLLELANVFEKRGCTIAYNLDGGGSSTLYFNGKIINNPTDGRTVGEREVSDIVYIGY